MSRPKSFLENLRQGFQTERDSGKGSYRASTKPWRVMMRVKVREIGPGLHPSETVVEIQTVGGAEKLVVDRKSIQDRTIFVGWRPVAEKKGQWLIELPRETMSGTWRVWVKHNDIVSDDREAMRA